MARIPASSMHVGAHPPSEFRVGEDDKLAEEMAVLQGNVFNGESVDGVFRGQPGGVRLLAVTNKRLMVLDESAFEDRTALISIPLKGVSGVAFLAGPGEEMETTNVVGIMMMGGKHEVICGSEDEARQLHDMLIWAIT